MDYMVTYAEQDRPGGRSRDRQETFKSLKKAREFFEDLRHVKRVYWARISERESPSHCVVRLDSWTKNLNPGMHKLKWKIIGEIGDKNPIEYGGGVIIESPDGDFTVHYTHGLETEGPDVDIDEDPYFEMTVYRVNLEDSGEEFLNWNDWVNWEDVARTNGQDIEVYESENLNTPHARAMAIWDAAGHYGWHEFDHYPEKYTIEQIEKMWELELKL